MLLIGKGLQRIVKEDDPRVVVPVVAGVGPAGPSEPSSEVDRLPQCARGLS